MAQHDPFAVDQRDEVVWLPVDEIARTEAFEKSEHVAVLAVQHVQAGIDDIAAGRVGPAARAPAEARFPLDERDAQPASVSAAARETGESSPTMATC